MKKPYPLFIVVFCQLLFAVNSIAQTDSAANHKSHYVSFLLGITTLPHGHSDFEQLGGGYFAPQYLPNAYYITAPVSSLNFIQESRKRTGKTISLNYYRFIKAYFYAPEEDTIILGGTLDTNYNVVGGTKYYDRSGGHINIISLEFLLSTRLLKPGKKTYPVVNYGIHSAFINVTKSRALSYPDGTKTIVEGPFNWASYGLTFGVSMHHSFSERFLLIVDVKSHIPGPRILTLYSRPPKFYQPYYGSIFSLQAGLGYEL